MNTPCERCGATLRPGRSPTQCEHCRDHTARPAPAGGEDSGLIDIRTMTRMLGGAAIRPVTPIPTFGGLAPAGPGAMNRPAARPPTPISRPSQTPLHVLLGVLVFGVVGLAGAVVHSATRTADAGPTALNVDAPSVQPMPAAAVGDAEVVKTKPAPPDEPDHQPGATADTPDKQPESPRKQPRPAPRPGKPELAKPVVAPEQPAKVDDRETVACLLEPGTCGAKREAAPTPSPAPTVDTGLPAKLESADISDGTRAAKASATSRCGPLAKGGETVKIKLSIAGPTGAVLSTSPESDAGNPALATCCANELKAAQFRSVQKAQIGAVVTLKF